MKNFRRAEALLVTHEGTPMYSTLAEVIAMAKAFEATAPLKVGDRVVFDRDFTALPYSSHLLTRGSRGVVTDVNWRGPNPGEGWSLVLKMDADRSHTIGPIPADFVTRIGRPPQWLVRSILKVLG